MQQKYCDHGRSRALLTMTRPTPRPRKSCGSGGNPRNASIFSRREQFHRHGRGFGEPTDIFGRIEPDMGGHGADEQVPGRAQALHADSLALQIRDAPDAIPREQFEAADMQAADDRDRHAGIDRHEILRRKGRREVLFAASELACHPLKGDLHEADIGEALGPQELLGDELGRDADAGILRQPDAGGLQLAFLRKRAAAAQQARDARRSERGKKPTTGLRDVHHSSPYYSAARSGLQKEADVFQKTITYHDAARHCCAARFRPGL
jgi:hypothetical protein